MKRIGILQYGDFKEAYERFLGGGAETYRDQRASVEFVTGLAPHAQVTTLAFCPHAYALTELAPNLRSAGLGRAQLSANSITQHFDALDLTHLILRTPHLGAIREARRSNVKVLPVFADIFQRRGIRSKWQNYRLQQALRAVGAPCFSNHSLNASRSMHNALGLPREQIVPWDWSKVPVVPNAKSAPVDPNRLSAFFAGAVSDVKGVGDCLEALALLKTRGVIVTMAFAGSGDLEHWRAVAAHLEIEAQVAFLGLISNAQVRSEMNRHDFVIVPSRHEYPEGLPNTIYEGLASRSVLLLSDHPAFTGRLNVEEQCLMFEASNPMSLAECIARVGRDGALYERLSSNGRAAHDGLYVGLPWTQLISRFLADPDNATGWIEANMLDQWEAA